jgi:uncharacterized protein (TIGR02597 family)
MFSGVLICDKSNALLRKCRRKKHARRKFILLSMSHLGVIFEMMIQIRTLCFATLASATLVISPLQAATTDPVGYVNWDIAAGTGSTRTISVVALPLHSTADITGSAKGKITAVSASTISASGADWSIGELSSTSAPYLIQITSGAAEGRTFLVSSASPNTSTTLTIDSSDAAQTDLTTLGINTTSGNEDTYKVIPCDTLSSIFGSPAETGVQGGAGSLNTADIVFVNIGGIWNKFYYDTNDSRWEKVTLGSPPAGDTPIRLEYGILYSRMASTPMNLTVTGSVPMNNRKFVLRNSGITFVSNGFPVDRTLADIGLENNVNWTSGATPAVSDTVMILANGIWKTFWYDGTDWRQQTLGAPIKNTEVVSASSAIIAIQRGVASGVSVVSQTKPY